MEKYDVYKLDANYINKINDEFFMFWVLLDKAFKEADVTKSQERVETFLHKIDMAGDIIDFGLHFDDEDDYCTVRDTANAKHALDIWEVFNKLRDNKHSMEFANAVTAFVESENAAQGF